MADNEHPCAYHPNATNANSEYKRTIRNNSKLCNWAVRNNSRQMNEVLNPNEFDQPKSECSCECVDVCPPKVTRTAGGIRWRGKKKKPLTNSKYHARCFNGQTNPRVQPTNIKRNVVSSSHCANCAEKHKTGKFKNECYCFSRPNKPLLPVKPMVSQPNTNRRVIKSGFKAEECDEKYYDIETLKKAKNLLDYAPESEFLRKLLQQASKTFDCQCSACKTKCKLANMKYTKRRQLLEDAYEDIESAVQSLDHIATMYHRCKMKCEGCKTSAKNTRSSLSPQYSPRTSRHFTAMSPENSPRSRNGSGVSPKSSQKFNSAADMNDCDKICATKRIRDEHYFDTHSTSFNLSPSNVPDHKCVYKFALDNRLLPTPLHADAFGVSRCSKCNKPMECAYAREKKFDDEEKVENITNYSQENNARKSREESAPIKQHNGRQSAEKSPTRKYSSPTKLQDRSSKNFSRRISIPGKNEIVELIVPPPPLLLTNKKCELKLRVPDNTWALRYQKGVV